MVVFLTAAKCKPLARILFNQNFAIPVFHFGMRIAHPSQWFVVVGLKLNHPLLSSKACIVTQSNPYGI
jgi:hypothetical protein